VLSQVYDTALLITNGELTLHKDAQIELAHIGKAGRLFAARVAGDGLGQVPEAM
jgi:hypothetical protein